MSVRIILGDVREKLADLPDESAHCVVTSPPYFGLRDYGVAGQIGLEPTLAEFVAVLVTVFREVRRVLRPDGVLFLNLGDSYAGKQLLGIPWRVAFALQADGWYLRQDIIWAKPNPMPEPVTDRCTKAHEYLFLLSKSPRYQYDAEAIAEAATEGGNRRSVWTVATQPYSEAHFATFPPDLIEPCIKAGCPKDCCAKCGAPVVRLQERGEAQPLTPADAGRKVTWTKGDAKRDPANRDDTPLPRHYRPVLSENWLPSCSCDAGLARGMVLDPFGGAGTTGLVADRLQRSAILIELNPEYLALATERITDDAPLFATVT